MLQRAASNSHSWWWASHIRSKQSRWIDGNLQDVEDKVKSVLKLIEEDADSFAKKAEMYYRRRPELIRSIQDIYNSHRALAERFERVSGELQNANDTIAAVFPDLVHGHESQESEGASSSTRKKQKLKKISPKMSKEKAREEIYKLQREIVVLQMEKEFMKSSYLNSLAKYLDIEKTIMELQEEVNDLQDESGAEIVIEDDETRALMAVTALKSCEDLLSDMYEHRNRFTEDGRIEARRATDFEEKLLVLKKKKKKIDCSVGSPGKNGRLPTNSTSTSTEEGVVCNLELQSVCDKFIENFKMGIDAVNMLEFSEKIDELVVKVIDLESTASAHQAHLHGLRLGMDELEKNLQVTEAEEENTDKLISTEEELQTIKEIEREVEDERTKFVLQFSEACGTFNALSDRLQSPKKQDEVLYSESSLEQDSITSMHGQTVEICEADGINVVYKEEDDSGDDDDLLVPDWEQLFKNGMEDRERILLTEYTTVLRNYKEAKRRLADEDKKTKDFESDTVTQIRELKNAIEMRDEQIRSLQQELKIIQTSWNKSSDDELTDQVKAVSEEQRDENVELSKEVAATDDSEIKQIDEPKALSSIEQKFRRDVDRQLEENLQFWLRFNTCFGQIQKFQSKMEDLQADIEGLRSTSKARTDEPQPASICKQLKDFEVEISTWVEENSRLKEELQTRLSSLCNVKEEIAKASTQVTELGEAQQLSGCQAARFNGEVLTITQENNAVADQLAVGLDHVNSLQEEVVKAIAFLEDSPDASKGKKSNSHRRSNNRSKTKSSSRSFLFNVKPLNPMKPLKFPCMKPQKKPIVDVGTADVP